MKLVVNNLPVELVRFSFLVIYIRITSTYSSQVEALVSDNGGEH
jgi:hypothetical protein